MAISMVEEEPASPAVRDYSVRELAGRRSFEEVAYLLWHGELPAHHEIVAQNRAERARRALDPHIAAALAELPVTEHPMDTLRTAVSLLGASDPARDDDSPEAVAAKALRLFAALPSVVAMDQRRRHGLGAIQPRDHLGYAANFLYMTFGKVPEPQIVAAFETSLTLHAQDRAPAAAFTARDPYDAVAAAIDALREPRDADGGAAVIAMLDEIAIPDNAGPWLEDALAAGRRITGFGRPAEPAEPRVPVMRAALGIVAALRRGQHLIDVYEALEAAAYEAKGLVPDLGYPSYPAYRLMGFDTPTFAPILATARVPGWTAALARLPSAPLGAPRDQRNET